MLTITSQQFGKLEDAHRAAFFRRLRANVTAFTNQAAPDISQMEFSYRLEHVLAMADRYGMLTEQQITRFAYLLLSFPTNFAKCTEYAWLAAVLESPASADERLDCITAALTDEENA